MTARNNDPLRDALSTQSIDIVIRLGFFCLLAYWSFRVIAPLLTILLWSAVLTVALYPLFDWLARWLGRRGLAATVISALCLMIVIGPVTWLGFGLIGAIGSVINGLDAGQLAVSYTHLTLPTNREV